MSKQVTPPPPISIPNSVPPDAPHITITLDEPPKPESLPSNRRILDVVRFFLLGFFLAFGMGILAIVLPFFYRRLHIDNRRRKISFSIGHALGTIGGIIWQAWIIFLFVILIQSN